MHNCTQCSVKCVSKIDLEDHVRSVHENNPHCCDLCDFTTPKTSALQVHLQDTLTSVKTATLLASPKKC